ncbi:MAG: hypothetical protein U0990_05580 [Candidatus Nanopelagicales bacterium]|nr:hypothetical protein [Candidatus Nanopelagicales bacterium]MDZ4249544.1 hypothetical protein [Candidatus Nanopelagicales bacterium]
MAKGSGALPPLITTALVVMMNLGGLLVLANAGVIEFPTVGEPSEAVAEQPVVAESAGLSLIADRAVADAVDENLPTSWEPTGGVQRRAADLFAYACGHWPLPASISAQRSVRIPGVGSATISAYAVPAGYGAATVEDVYEFVTACPGRDSYTWGQRAEVNQASAAVLGLTSGQQTASQVLWNRGDLLLSITAGGRSPLLKAASQWDRIVAASLSGLCRDLKEKLTDTRRNPWVDPERYKGLMEQETVSVSKPQVQIPMPRKQRGARKLPDRVDRPEPPSHPHWPTALPAERVRPEPPNRPARPKLKAKITYQVADPTGPGCGWAWLSQPAPTYTEAEALAQRAQATTEALERLRRGADRWLVDESEYRQGLAEYYAQVIIWKDYAEQVNAAAAAWQRTQEAWDQYESARWEYQRAVARRSAWKQEYDAAAAAYAEAVARCAAPGPSPSPSPPAEVTDPDCPPVKPRILSESRPSIPPKPTPPPDPSPMTSPG